MGRRGVRSCVATTELLDPLTTVSQSLRSHLQRDWGEFRSEALGVFSADHGFVLIVDIFPFEDFIDLVQCSYIAISCGNPTQTRAVFFSGHSTVQAFKSSRNALAWVLPGVEEQSPYFDTGVHLRDLTRLTHFCGQYFIDERLVRFSFFLGGLT